LTPANAQRVLGRYKAEYSWFDWGNEDQKTTIRNAWKLYAAAANNQLGTLVLGDAKIRTNDELLFAAFPPTSAKKFKR